MSESTKDEWAEKFAKLKESYEGRGRLRQMERSLNFTLLCENCEKPMRDHDRLARCLSLATTDTNPHAEFREQTEAILERNRAIPVTAEELARLRDLNHDLVKALQAIINECSDYPPHPPFSSDSFLPWQFIDAARAAIAKAGIES